ncbi:hypothetical protein ACIBSV_49585 [Embleya sp. NPDC050154]|uniref:hypothetical protein n=1 Tax=unclassified Embleya TaxID=2699296 RepID=UPI0037A4AEED
MPEPIAQRVCQRLRMSVGHREVAKVLLGGQTDFGLLYAVDASLTFGVQGAWIADRIRDNRNAHGVLARGFTIPTDDHPQGPLAQLRSLLDDCGSAYRIKDDNCGLEERTDPTAREAVLATIADATASTTSGSAGDHLATAWAAAYGMHPDPVRAFSESIKAIEAAGHAIVQTNHATATLGTMLGELKGVPHKFEFTVAVGPD